MRLSPRQNRHWRRFWQGNSLLTTARKHKARFLSNSTRWVAHCVKIYFLCLFQRYILLEFKKTNVNIKNVQYYGLSCLSYSIHEKVTDGHAVVMGSARYSDRSIFRQVYILTGLYSDRSIFRQVVIPTGRYSDRSIFRQVYISTGRYSDRSLFRQVVIPTGLYSDMLIFQQVVILIAP